MMKPSKHLLLMPSAAMGIVLISLFAVYAIKGSEGGDMELAAPPEARALLSSTVASSAAILTTPLARAHAHNDYEHQRPLLDALKNGFCSVEADIYLVDGKLLVAHDLPHVKPERTLEALYLEPLQKRVQANGGNVYHKNDGFSLLIDIKSDPIQLYPVLREVLSKYKDVLTAFEGNEVHRKVITVVLSGNRPRAALKAEKLRYAAMDGRIEDLDGTEPASFIPWISESWVKHFQWRGAGPLPEEQRQKLRDIVKRCHAQGRRLRFWATLDDPIVWKVLRQENVDLIGADNLTALTQFLTQEKDHGP